MKLFEFTGFGNYSECHNWDGGLDCHLSEEVDPASVNEEDDFELRTREMCDVLTPTGWLKCLRLNQYGGSRNAWGYVWAASKEDAEQMLKTYSSFPVTHYVQAGNEEEEIDYIPNGDRGQVGDRRTSAEIRNRPVSERGTRR